MSDEAPRPAANCHYCGKRIKPTKTNKQRSYCDDKCKQSAYRARMRRRSDSTIVDAIIAEQHRIWRRDGYSNILIQALMALWYEYGGPALGDVQQILQLHQDIVVEQWAAKYTRDMDAHEAGVKRQQELYEARLRESEEKSRNGS